MYKSDKYVFLKFKNMFIDSDHTHDLRPTRCVQCWSGLFVSGRTVVYKSHYKRPKISTQKLTLAAPTIIGYS